MTTRLPIACCFAASLLAAGCHHTPAPTMSAPQAPSAGIDDGAAVLADVENARQAIGRHALLAAANDLNRGLDHADQLAGAASTVFPDDAPPAAHAAPARRMSRFAVLVRLQSADAELANGDVADAERDLVAIEAGAPAAVLPPTFPLLRAEEGLDVAEGDIAGNQASDLAPQLAIAQLALQSYARPAHRTAAGVLAGEIGQALARPDATRRILPDQVAAWATQVSGWI